MAKASRRAIQENDKLAAIGLLVGDSVPSVDVYVLEGSDGIVIARLSEILRNAILQPGQEDFDLDVIECESSTGAERIVSALSEYPVMGGKRLLILNNAHNLKDKVADAVIEALEKNLAYHANAVIMTCTATTIDSLGWRAYQSQTYETCVISCKFKGDDCSRWIEHLLRQKGLSFHPSVSREISERLGNSTQFVLSQLGKLHHYLGERREITMEDVQRVIAKSVETKTYELTKALDERDRDRAWSIAENLLSDSPENKISQSAAGNKSADVSTRALGLLSYLNTYLRSLAHLHSLTHRYGTRLSDLSPHLKGRKEFQIRNDLRNLSKWSEVALRQALLLLCDTDMQIKSGRDPRLAVDLLLATLCIRKR